MKFNGVKVKLKLCNQYNILTSILFTPAIGILLLPVRNTIWK